MNPIPTLNHPKGALTLTMNHLIKRFTSIACPTLSASAVDTKVKDFVSKGLYDQTLDLYKEELHPSGLHAGTSILPSVIKACSSAQCHHFGLQLHCVAVKSGSHSEPVTSNSLISMYAKFSCIDHARKVFDTMPYRDTITWNSMVNAYVKIGYCIEALEMFKEMYVCGFIPKPELIASVLSICGRNGDLRLGRVIHALAIVDGRIEEESVFLSTALVDFYLRCRDPLMAFRVFDRMKLKNEVSWTAMISGCIADQSYGMAIDCFRTMQLVEGIKPNRVTLIAVLPAACAEWGSIKPGKEIHGYAFRHGFDSEFRLSSALIHMYCECRGEGLQDAKLIFERTKEKDVVMWSSIIRSFSRSGDSVETMKHFRQMQLEGIEPNSVTLLAIVSACTNLSSLNNGRGVHGYILKSSSNSDIFIGNSLINMYSKCGCLVASQQIFEEMPIKDSVSWSTLISAYGLHGCGEEALRLFDEMQERGMEVDAMTFLAILSACNHAGLVEEGQKLFDNVVKEKKIALTIEHYACHIDLLGRSGKLEDACEVVSTIMPMKPSTRIWSSLVSACKNHGRLEVAEMVAHRLIESEPENAANYTLLSMVYAESSDWLGVEQVRRVMRERGLKKSYGFSRIELESGSSQQGEIHPSCNYCLLSMHPVRNPPRTP